MAGVGSADAYREERDAGGHEPELGDEDDGPDGEGNVGRLGLDFAGGGNDVDQAELSEGVLKRGEKKQKSGQKKSSRSNSDQHDSPPMYPARWPAPCCRRPCSGRHTAERRRAVGQPSRRFPFALKARLPVVSVRRLPLPHAQLLYQNIEVSATWPRPPEAGAETGHRCRPS